MSNTATIELVQKIMPEFARLTGLSPARAHPRRYLWTDAFAVCNYLELYSQTNNKAHLDLALQLVDQVHHVLGKHRGDDPRQGWISGLDAQQGKEHPTVGGLRIGKQLNERKPNEPSDERLEWDQDGQYYHYLTKWMHALNCVSQATRDPPYIRWAIELAKTAHAKFTFTPPYGSRKRMHWKMSIDLSYPLVPSMGQHDPLDGFVTYYELQATAANYRDGSSYPDLRHEIVDMARICQEIQLLTDDPLGIGSLLYDAYRIAQLMAKGQIRNLSLLETVVHAASMGVESIKIGGSLEYPAEYKLAFRELGLSIGLSAVERMLAIIEENPNVFRKMSSLPQIVEDLREYMPLGETIERFWMDNKNRQASTWIEHREINMVMLATSLAPNRFLSI